MRWPWPGDLEHFLRRPEELEAWVAEIDETVVGHVAIQSVPNDELGRMWADAHGVPTAQLRCISVLFADRRRPAAASARRCSLMPLSGRWPTAERRCWMSSPGMPSR